jgi:REP element-mobilizing transposase RayT
MTWLPDHPRGYTKRGEGYQDPDPQRAQWYRGNADDADACLFDEGLMRALIDEAQKACAHQQLHLHSGTTEKTHLHLLISWRDNRKWETVRNAIKMSLSLRLKSKAEQALNTPRKDTQIKLSRGGSRKRVEKREHFDYLMQTYLPSHSGLKWFEDRGFVAPRKRK